MLNLTQAGSVSTRVSSRGWLSSGGCGLVLFLTLVLTLSGLLVSTPAHASSLTPVPTQSTSTPVKPNNRGIKTPKVISGQDGSVDSLFRSGSGPNGGVTALAIQSDGKIVIAGYFTTYNDRAVNDIIRVNSDGSLDVTFNSGGSGPNGVVSTVVWENTGKLLIGGSFTTYNGVTANHLARLNIDGSLDTSFNPGGSGLDNSNYGAINVIALQSDSKILIGGAFATYNGVSVNSLLRLNPDGTPDSSFHFSGTGSNFPVSYNILALAIQGDGKLLIGGNFSKADSSRINCIARLNVDGSLDNTFNPGGSGTTNVVQALSIQNDGKILISLVFYWDDSQPFPLPPSYNGVRVMGVARLNANGSLDTSFNSTNQAFAYVIAPLSNGKVLAGNDYGFELLDSNGTSDFNFGNGKVDAIAVQPNGKIFIGGFFSPYRNFGVNNIALLNSDITSDTSFNPGSTGAYNPPPTLGAGRVSAIIAQPNGKILVGGNFYAYNGSPTAGLTRLNSDGSIDVSFKDSGYAFNYTIAMAVQSDGKILVSGYQNFNNTSYDLVRLNPDGTLDTSFNPGKLLGGNTIKAIAVQNDGKVLIAGDFDSYNMVNIGHVARLNTDGTLDLSFNSGNVGTNANVSALLLQRDGKIVLGGSFTTYNGLTTNHLTRLNSDGSFDSTFVSTGTNGYGIDSLTLENDNKILIGGDFTTYNGVTANSVARLNPNGTLDTSFSAGSGTNSTYYNLNITTIVPQNDGKILLGGSFTTYNGTPVNRIARLNSDGSLDSSFNPGAGANDLVYTIALQNDGKVLVGGAFSSVDTYTRDHIARLYNTVKTSSTVLLTSNPNPSRAGESLTFTATVQPATATGTVRFDLSTGSSSASVTSTVVNGAASYVTSTTQVGVMTVTASYSGDANLPPSTSSSYVQLVNPGPPNQLLVVNGSNQQTSVNRIFDLPLVTRVTDALNNPVGGVVVTFTAPSSGPSLSFAGGTATYTGTTNASGLATSPGLTANGLTGVYSVTAIVAGVNNPATFNLINMAVCDAFVVTSTQDDGSCGTLRSALQAAANSQTSKTKIITLPFPAGTTINLAFGLKLASRVELVSSASCGVGPNNSLLPPIILQGGSGDGLTLANNNRLSGLWVRGFSGVQIKAPAGSHTTMQCVKASKN